MLTIIFLVVFGGLVVGFLIYELAFGKMKRRGQSGDATLHKRSETEGRASGLD